VKGTRSVVGRIKRLAEKRTNSPQGREKYKKKRSVKRRIEKTLKNL